MRARTMRTLLRLWGGMVRAGVAIIALSLLLGFGTLALELIAFIETGTWTSYTPLDFNRTVGWTTPHEISASGTINFLWDAFLHEGSLALIFILYLPLIVLLTGYACWQLAALLKFPIGRSRQD